MFWFPFNDTKSKWVILIHYCTIMPNDSQFYFMFRSWQSTSMQNPVNHEKSVFVWRTQFPFHIAMNQNCSSLLSPRRGWVSLDESCVLLGASYDIKIVPFLEKKISEPYHRRYLVWDHSLPSEKSWRTLTESFCCVFDKNLNSLIACASWVHNILTTVMTNIVEDKSAEHAKPLSIC